MVGCLHCYGVYWASLWVSRLYTHHLVSGSFEVLFFLERGCIHWAFLGIGVLFFLSLSFKYLPFVLVYLFRRLNVFTVWLRSVLTHLGSRLGLTSLFL